jgi:hypothetical protein
VLSAVILWFHFVLQPPQESTILAIFYSHRTQYEQLRGMLLSDDGLTRVANSGIQTSESPIVAVPTEAKFPPDRYREYLTLLREVGGKGAYRTSEKHPEVGVQMWTAGFGGDTRHVNVCWREDEPPNQVASLDEFYRTAKRTKSVYRHIDGNWWIWADR